MKKRILAILICYILLIISVIGIITVFNTNEENRSNKIQIIATIFPDYDFVKRIGGEYVEVKLLLDSGVDSHNYEPSVRNMKNISDSDIFIYTGMSSEPWAKEIIDSLENSNCKIVDSSENIDLIESDKFSLEYNALNSNDNHDHSDNLEDYEYDGHIWLDPQNAMKMIDNICDALCEYDNINSNYYRKNAEDYKNEIQKLDLKIEEALKNMDTNVLVFGGEFAYSYFIKRYDLKYVSVYSSCGEEAEPSVQDVRNVIDYINENNITKVFYEELTEGTVAKMISEETKAKPIIFYTLHNVSNEEIEAGANYISVMEKNLENITNNV